MSWRGDINRMSHSEFKSRDSDAEDLAAAMMRFGEQLCLRPVCVHADHWAAAATLGDSEVGREALLTSCLVGSARASAGTQVLPARLDPAAHFHDLPFVQLGGWRWVACASLTEGCLLALGQGSGTIPDLAGCMEPS